MNAKYEYCRLFTSNTTQLARLRKLKSQLCVAWQDYNRQESHNKAQVIRDINHQIENLKVR